MVRKKCPCGNRPSYNLPGQKPARFCSKCKTDEMIDVVTRRCLCGTIPTFNMPGETKGMCCFKCKTNDMINVTDQTCKCGTRPNFNIPGETKGVCCKDCKTDEMINVKSKRCSCGKQPHFNLPGKTTGVCCKDCKTDEMIDVVHKRCPCGTISNFNYLGERFGICCIKCKTDGMIDVVNKVCPGYNEPCPVRTHIGNSHKYCMSCDPNDARRKRYKLYEEEFFAYIKNKIDVQQRNFTVSFDPTETAKKRAFLDGIVFGDGIIVCLEVDENGHQDYECDEHRMHLVTAELLQKYPDNVVSWVRVNPTVDSKSQQSKSSKKKREKRFEEVIATVDNILETRDTRVVYIGFESNIF